MTEAIAERTFLAIYGSPALQAAVGIDPAGNAPAAQGEPRACCISELMQKRIAELKARIPAGGLREALIRALLYVGMARGAVDERGFEARAPHPQDATATCRLPQFKALVREQFYMLLIDQEAALAAIPAMLPPDAETRQQGVRADQAGAERARRAVRRGRQQRLAEVARLFGVDAEGSAAPTPFRQIRREPQAQGIVTMRRRS